MTISNGSTWCNEKSPGYYMDKGRMREQAENLEKCSIDIVLPFHFFQNSLGCRSCCITPGWIFIASLPASPSSSSFYLNRSFPLMLWKLIFWKQSYKSVSSLLQNLYFFVVKEVKFNFQHLIILKYLLSAFQLPGILLTKQTKKNLPSWAYILVEK